MTGKDDDVPRKEPAQEVQANEHVKVFFLALAALGKETWNAWRDDPENADVRVTFAGVDFSESPLDEIDFAGFEFGDEADFSGCRWRDTLFRQVHNAPNTFKPGQASFENASFGAEANFRDVTFGEKPNFAGAKFGVCVDFAGSTFGNRTDFTGTIFDESPDFAGTNFGPWANFAGAKFGYGAGFTTATFGRSAIFTGTKFGNVADFTGSTISNGTDFTGAIFGEEASFAAAVFGERVIFTNVTFGDKAAFNRVTFGNKLEFAAASFGHSATFTAVLFRDPVNFADVTFDEKAEFTDAVFLGKSTFTNATFGNGANFSRTTFRNKVDFVAAAFGDRVAFKRTIFKDCAEFSGKSSYLGTKDFDRSSDTANSKEKVSQARLKGQQDESWRFNDCGSDRFLNISFAGACFHADSYFLHRSVDQVADFTNTSFYRPPDFDGATNIQRIDFTGAKITFVRPGHPHWTSQSSVAIRLRALRRLAEDTKNHDLERDLYIEERKAERGVYLRQHFRALLREPTRIWTLFSHILWIGVMAAYWALADYGRSFLRPLFWLIASWAFFRWRYEDVFAPVLQKLRAMGDLQAGQIPQYHDAIHMLALGHAVPFVGAFTVDSDIKKFLLCGNARHCTLIPPPCYQGLVITQNLISILLVFFIGLALRNYFKIK